MRLPKRWAAWVEQDIAAPGFVLWSAASAAFLCAVAAAGITVILRRFPTPFVVAFLCTQWGPLLVPRGRRWLRDRDLSWQRRKWERHS